MEVSQNGGNVGKTTTNNPFGNGLYDLFMVSTPIAGWFIVENPYKSIYKMDDD